MTGRQYAEEVLRRLSGGNISDDFEIKADDLFPTIDNALKDTLVQYLANVSTDLNGGWVKTYECQTINKECVCGCDVWSWDIPVNLLQLPMDKGIVLVRNKFYSEYTYIPLEKLPSFSAFPVWNSSKVFWVDGKKLFFTKKDTIFVSIIPSSKYAEELPIPSGYGQVFENLVWEQAVKFFSGYKDLINNSSMTNNNTK